MNAHNNYFYKEVNKKYIDCNLKTTEICTEDVLKEPQSQKITYQIARLCANRDMCGNRLKTIYDIKWKRTSCLQNCWLFIIQLNWSANLLQYCLCAQGRPRSACAPSGSVYAIRFHRLWLIGYLQNTLWRLWAQCADALADLCLR